MEPRFYKVEEAAKILNTKTSTVRTFCREGKIPALKVGRGYRIAKEDLEEWLRLQKQSSTSLREEQQRLLEAEAKYQDLFENASDGIVLFDIVGRLTLANPKFLELFGYTLKEAVGMHFAKLVSPDDLPVISELFMARIAGEDVPICSGIKALRKDGQVIYVEGSSAVLMKEGQITGLQIIARDITDRKRAEEALAASEEKYRSLVENSLEGIGISKGNQVVFANKALLDIFGYQTLKEMCKISLLDHVAPKSRAMIQERLKKRKKGESGVARYQYAIVRKDGEIRDLEISACEIIIDGEKYIQSTFRDITEHKKAEEARRESDEMYKMLVRASPEAVIVVDLEGTITHVSKRTLELFGYQSRKELVGKSAFMLVEQSMHQQGRINMQRLLTERIRENTQYKFLRADGTCFIGEVNSAVIRDYNGQPKRFISTTRKISEGNNTIK